MIGSSSSAPQRRARFPGAVIVMRKTAPMGDPIEINVRGYELSIRKSEAQNIRVEVSE